MATADEYFVTLGDTIVREKKYMIDFFLDYARNKRKRGKKEAKKSGV